METERILITVRTYPNPSTRYRETVCVGGITNRGEWRRLYPVPLRQLPREQRFHTWDVIEIPVSPGKDGRFETRRPHLPSLRIVDHIKSWKARCQWVEPTIIGSMNEMKAKGRSLGAVTSQSILEFRAEKDNDEWDPARKQKLEQNLLFDDKLPLEKIPYRFRFHWCDGDRAEHTSLVISWELAQAWREFRKRYSDPVDRLRAKLLTETLGSEREVSFFMGNDSRRRNVFMVCGWFAPPRGEANREQLWSDRNPT